MDWANIIQTLGFPIAVCCACGFFIYKMYNNNNAQSIEREEKSFNMLSKFQVSIDKFADILKEYDKRMLNIETDVKEIKDIVVK